MILSLLGLKPARPSIRRPGPVLDGTYGAGRESRSFTSLGRRPRREIAATSHLYFAVRSVVADGRRHVMQYAFVDDRGHVALSALVRTPSPVMVVGAPAAEDLAVEPMDAQVFEDMALKLCAGASLVAFHRVLQTGLLSEAAVKAAATTECAWRRFQVAARRRGIRLSRWEPLALNDCLEKAGLAPLRSEDAALRALAIRDLWRWMDEAE